MATAPLDGQNAAQSPDQSSQDPNGSDIPRDKPEPDEKRRKLVADWSSKVKKAKDRKSTRLNSSHRR